MTFEEAARLKFADGSPERMIQQQCFHHKEVAASSRASFAESLKRAEAADRNAESYLAALERMMRQ